MGKGWFALCLSLRNLGVLGGSAVNSLRDSAHRRAAKPAEVPQRSHNPTEAMLQTRTT